MVGFFDMHNLTFVDASRRIPLRFSAIQIQFGVESGLGRTPEFGHFQGPKAALDAAQA